MRDPKEKTEGIQEKAENEQSYEISNTGYGLESVAKGNDFAEGDQNNPPSCGGL